jgi:hypothetical protein
MDGARTRISLLTAWRRGAAVAALSSVALVVTGLFGTVAPLVGFGTAICVIGGAETARRYFLRKCALCCELEDISAVARYRERLCSARSRMTLATWLRDIARDSHAAGASPYVLWDRVTLVRHELLALADELESADAVDARTMIEIRTLLSDGRDSPLFNDQIPPAALVSTIRCARFRAITGPRHDPIERVAIGPVRPVPAPGSGRRARAHPLRDIRSMRAQGIGSERAMGRNTDDS